jgi:hypothetical protein
MTIGVVIYLPGGGGRGGVTGGQRSLPMVTMTVDVVVVVSGGVGGGGR